jgi:hypothetical protein
VYNKYIKGNGTPIQNRTTKGKKVKTKTREQLINEGYPYISAEKGDEFFFQVFLTEWACEVRMKELKEAGYKVERYQ